MYTNGTYGKGEVCLKKTFLATMTATIAVATCVPTAEATLYEDIPASSAYYETLLWAKDRGVIKGFSDGTFKPEMPITEAQFALMLTRLIDASVLQQEAQQQNEREAAYTFLQSLGVTFDGDNRNRAFTRLEVAKAFYIVVEGDIANEHEVIDWMYAHGLTTGKGVSADRYEDFGGSDILKRMHAAQFFRNFYTKVYAERMYIDKTTYTKFEVAQLQQQEIAPVYADMNNDGVDELIMYHNLSIQSPHLAANGDRYIAIYTLNEKTNVYQFDKGTMTFNVAPNTFERLQNEAGDDVLVTFTSGRNDTAFAVLSKDAELFMLPQTFAAASWQQEDGKLYITDRNGTQHVYTIGQGQLIKKQS